MSRPKVQPWMPAVAASEAARAAPTVIAIRYCAQCRTERYTVVWSATSAVNGANVATAAGRKCRANIHAAMAATTVFAPSTRTSRSLP